MLRLENFIIFASEEDFNQSTKYRDTMETQWGYINRSNYITKDDMYTFSKKPSTYPAIYQTYGTVVESCSKDTAIQYYKNKIAYYQKELNKIQEIFS